MEIQTLSSAEFLRAASEAVDHLDAAQANQLLRQWSTALGTAVTAPQATAEWETLRQDLLMVAFAFLPAELARLVVEQHLLAFLASDQKLGNPTRAVEERIQVAGYGSYNEERERLKQAALANRERLGALAVTEWLMRFAASQKETESDPVSAFLLQAPEVAQLSKQDQQLLRLLLTLYRDWLAGPIISVFDVAALAQGGRAPAGAPAGQSGQPGTGQGGLVALPLLQALAKFPGLGNQTLSQERIRVKNQLDPVRGSLTNWLKCYRDELGIGRHTSVERGQFLFRSENGRKLHPEERERVNLVLKSLEENLPLQIDARKQEIIFPHFDAPRSPQPAARRQSAAAAQMPGTAGNFAQGGLGVSRPQAAPLPTQRQAAPQAAPGGSMSFTTNHVLPAEQKPGQPSAPAASQEPPQPPLAPRKANRFHIRPVSLSYGEYEDQ